MHPKPCPCKAYSVSRQRQAADRLRRTVGMCPRVRASPRFVADPGDFKEKREIDRRSPAEFPFVDRKTGDFRSTGAGRDAIWWVGGWSP